MYRHRFTPAPVSAVSRPTVLAAEALLQQWFGRPVVLTSSGRAALLLALRDAGLGRYRSRLAMPPLTAACVFDAVIRTAFPVDPAHDPDPVDATLLIHQYGHRQVSVPDGLVIEDICHAFFGGPETGARRWRGDVAIFSLPKFFGTAGMAGGLVVADEQQADRLRDARDAAPRTDAEQLAHDRAGWRQTTGATLEAIYLRALLHPACDPAALAGLPASQAELAATGERRAAIARRLVDALPAASLPDEWRAICLADLPFAIPVFGDPARLDDLAGRIEAIGIESGPFRIDKRRNMRAPDFQSAILLPCHQQIDDDCLDALVGAIGGMA